MSNNVRFNDRGTRTAAEAESRKVERVAAMEGLSAVNRGSERHVRTARPEAGAASMTTEPWDEFVAATPGGDLVQTTAWAEAKRALGLEVCHVLVRSGQDIVGGAQIVIKRFGPLGGVGYVARGPLLATGYRGRAAEVIGEIEHAARVKRVRHLIIQPPEGGDDTVMALAARGYAPDAPEVAPAATMRLDLSQSLDRILARVSGSKRKQIRRGQREGVEIRIGGPGDLDLFHTLHTATARRQGFAGRSRSYLQHHWDALHPRGFVQLIFACHKGRALAAIWLTPFGEAAVQRLSGSSLEGRHLQPNVACRWGAIRWAKEHGYRCFDFGGIDRRFAELLAAKQPLPDEFHRSTAAMKREFGPDPVLLPTASQLTFNPIARLAVRSLYSKLARAEPVRRLIHGLRNG